MAPDINLLSASRLGPRNIQEDFAKIRQQWEAVKEVLEDEELFELRDESVSAWSCGQQAGHVALAAFGIAAGIERSLKEPRFADEKPADFAMGLLESGEFPRGRAEAPEGVIPDRSRRELLLALRAAQRGWRKLESRVEELEASPARFRHFLFGYLSLPDWVRFCAVHNAHHLKIIQDIRQPADE